MIYEHCTIISEPLYMWFPPGRTQSACFSSSNKTMALGCGPGYLLHITRAFYGFSPTGQCRLMEGEKAQGCTVEDRERYGCIGKSGCSINLPTGQWGVNVPECGQRSNYYQVEYNCVRGKDKNHSPVVKVPGLWGNLSYFLHG